MPMGKKTVGLCEKKNFCNVSRRNFLKKVGTTAVGAGLFCATGGLLTGCGTSDQSEANSETKSSTESKQTNSVPNWPFTYVKLDPEKVAERTFQAYKDGG